MKTALRRLWRDPTTLQIGVHHDRAIVVGGVGEQTGRLIAAFDGTHDASALRATARELGLDASLVERLLSMLGDAAVLDDAAIDAGSLAALPLRERDRLAPDLASISVVSGRPDGGQSTMARRQQASICVVGGGRVGAAAATLLAAAGIGHLFVEDPETCRPADCSPAGPTVNEAGTSRAQAAHAAIHRVSQSTRTHCSPPNQQYDVVVLTDAAPPAPTVADQLVRAGLPHLRVAVREATAVVGPLVLPGTTACLRCLELHRCDRDPAWPLIAAQLAIGGQPWAEACDVALATMAASVCALQVLAFIDGGDPATIDGTLEIALPDWRIRRRSWSPHPACGCSWPGRIVAPDHGVDPFANRNLADA